ncbi:MAG: hypothetical protein IIA82_10160 [Thaumarchaeota archaeon]|nr:hypothetical protein [Nitrososphaerota archaeon]
MTFYFTLSVFYLPDFYQSLKTPIPIPFLSEVKISESMIHFGNSFDIEITATNTGDTADHQTVSVAFLNLTQTEGFVQITKYNFPQSPFLIQVGDEINYDYASSEDTITAPYPAIEAYGRPWESNVTYHLGLKVTPEELGTFVFYVKSVGQPHTDDLSHFPSDGLIDYQREFVKVYSVNVTEP